MVKVIILVQAQFARKAKRVGHTRRQPRPSMSDANQCRLGGDPMDIFLKIFLTFE